MWIPPAHSPFGLTDVLESLGSGEAAVKRFERHLAERFDAADAVGTGTGTQALQLAIEIALAAAPADRRVVALPAWGCYDIVAAAAGARVRAVFYDLDARTLSPAPEAFRSVARQAGVLVVANLYGLPLDWDLVSEVAEAGDAVVIEDAAQGVGSTWRERPGGTFGDLTVLSFGRGKGWTGGGGGGLLLRSESTLEAGRRRLAERPIRAPSGSRAVLSALAAGQWAFGRPSLYGFAARAPGLGLGETTYREPVPPAAIHPFQAALALASRDRASAEVEVRRRRAGRLREAVEASGADPRIRACRPRTPGESAELRLPVLFPPDRRPGPAARSLGIHPGYPTPLPTLPAARPLAIGPADPHPVAERLSRSLYTFPTHSRAPEEEVASAIASTP